MHQKVKNSHVFFYYFHSYFLFQKFKFRKTYQFLRLIFWTKIRHLEKCVSVVSKPKPRQKIKCGRNWPFVNSFVEFAVCGNPIFSSHGTNTTVASENDLFLWLLAFPFPDKSSSKKIRFDHNDAKYDILGGKSSVASL